MKVAKCTNQTMSFVVEYIWVKKMNDSVNAFSNNLLRYYSSKEFTSYTQMASDLGVSVGTLKCWMSGNRSPKLSTINTLADRLGCYSYNLIKPDGSTENIGVSNKDIHQVFSKRLRIIFLKKHAITYTKKLSILNDTISYDSLVSYLRKQNYRMPSLRTLDCIADALNINTYELLMEDELDD